MNNIDDLINRGQVISQLSLNKNKGNDEWELAVENDIQTIWKLPSIQPKHGHWKCSDDIYEYAVCSCCQYDTEEDWEYIEKHFKYCPNCGANMESED